MRKYTMFSPLPFPTKPVVINGVELEEYIIPEDKKAEVLKDMYVFYPVPRMGDEMEDVHSGKRFRVREFRITRENGLNLLVSPFYEEGGGTAIDWIHAPRKKKSPDKPDSKSEASALAQGGRQV